jgi:hypothetical protein
MLALNHMKSLPAHLELANAGCDGPLAHLPDVDPCDDVQQDRAIGRLSAWRQRLASATRHGLAFLRWCGLTQLTSARDINGRTGHIGRLLR